MASHVNRAAQWSMQMLRFPYRRTKCTIRDAPVATGKTLW